MTVNYSKVLTSLPPMYEAKCDECGSIDYFYCHECSEITDEDVRQVLGHKPLTFEQMKEIEAMHLQHDWESLRNQAAIAAMQGVMNCCINYSKETIARLAVEQADALIEELKKK